MNVKQLMTEEPVTCSPDETLHEAAIKMQQENIGLCPVIEYDKLVGLVTDRDITVRAVAKGLDVNEHTIRSIMTTNPIAASPNMTVEDACQLMSDHQVRRLPVLEDGRLVGIISLANLAVDLDEEEMVANTLQHICQP